MSWWAVLPRTGTATDNVDIELVMSLELEKMGLRNAEVSVLSEAEQ